MFLIEVRLPRSSVALFVRHKNKNGNRVIWSQKLNWNGNLDNRSSPGALQASLNWNPIHSRLLLLRRS